MRRTLHGSLRCRRNLITISDVCEAAARSLFWAPNRFNELTEVRFNFPSILIAKSTMAFQQANHGACSNPGTQLGSQNMDFGGVSQTDQRLVSSVAQAEVVIEPTFAYI